MMVIYYEKIHVYTIIVNETMGQSYTLLHTYSIAIQCLIMFKQYWKKINTSVEENSGQRQF